MINFTRPLVSMTVLLMLVAPILGGCQTMKNLGSYFPVHDKRCEDWFCFGDDEPKRAPPPSSPMMENPNAMPQTPSAAHYGSMPGATPFAPPPMPSQHAMPPSPMPPAMPATPQGAEELHPWEQNPPWETDGTMPPPTPTEKLKKALEW